MRKSLAMFGFFSLMFYMIAAIVAPFADPWFFLLSIPLIAMLPHMDKIAGYLFKILDE